MTTFFFKKSEINNSVSSIVSSLNSIYLVFLKPINVLALQVITPCPRETESNERTPFINPPSPILAPQEGRHSCDCGEAKINQERARLGSEKAPAAEKEHVCELSCPWILEGCLFKGPKELFGDHFQIHSKFDSQISTRKPQAFDPNSELNSSPIAKAAVAETPSPGVVKACGVWDRGVQGCLYEVSEKELQSHLESKEFLSLHMNLILDKESTGLV